MKKLLNRKVYKTVKKMDRQEMESFYLIYTVKVSKMVRSQQKEQTLK
ncbi:hypothetical protein [Anaerosalibacter massiliensis]|nr:hypothetical protein [Anaerosalibacter massiliensis]